MSLLTQHSPLQLVHFIPAACSCKAQTCGAIVDTSGRAGRADIAVCNTLEVTEQSFTGTRTLAVLRGGRQQSTRPYCLRRQALRCCPKATMVDSEAELRWPVRLAPFDGGWLCLQCLYLSTCAVSLLTSYEREQWLLWASLAQPARLIFQRLWRYNAMRLLPCQL